MLKRLIVLAPLLVQAVLAAPGLEQRHQHLHGQMKHGHRLGDRKTTTRSTDSATQETTVPEFIQPKMPFVKVPHKSTKSQSDDPASSKDTKDVTLPGFIAPKNRVPQNWKTRTESSKAPEATVVAQFVSPNKKANTQSSKKSRKTQSDDASIAEETPVPEFIAPKNPRKAQSADATTDEETAAPEPVPTKNQESLPDFVPPKAPFRSPPKPQESDDSSSDGSSLPEFIPPKSPFSPNNKPRDATDNDNDIIDDEFDYSDADFLNTDKQDNDAADTDSDADHSNDNSTLGGRGIGKRNILYFTNWGIYGANFQPQQIPAKDITHVLYSFLNIAEDGTVKSVDTWADTDKHYEGDSWNDSGNNVYGCVKQLYLLKKKYRNLKVLMSLGGWTMSPNFVAPASTQAGRKRIAASAVKLLGDWGFDGIDVDWEYPANDQQAQNYVDLLKEIRSALDKFSTDNRLNYRFLLTVATAAGPSHYNTMKLKAMDQYLDGWHLMAYDYAGGWDSTTGHQANVYLSTTNPLATKFSTEKAVNDYIAAGVPAQKILMGMALYGRSFANTDGLGKPYQGVGGGSVENGVYLLKDLPKPGAKAWTDKNLMATVTYDKTKRELVTMDNADSGRLKAGYINKRGLGGAFYWEASGDKTGSRSVISTVKRNLGAIEMSQNLLTYPTSIYDNLRAGMP
ncbi:hypothetical protein NM208_g13105 [Fusarium decemcellulare]|uniref:Uncharacterized protein n=1 Tax=Fusarium decemcellulare TaxID=57161 RepID=A0ACC1RL14_9HYPO|nr:hypothetical protein NM208_g13105 [Fusarium decemcellulare]